MKLLIIILSLVCFITPTAAQDRVYLENFTPQQWYTIYNEKYYLGALPSATVYSAEPGPGQMGLTFRDRTGFVIMISGKYNPSPKEMRITLLHEICHVVTWGQEFDDHGTKWQQCMHNLASRGAFDVLW